MYPRPMSSYRVESTREFISKSRRAHGEKYSYQKVEYELYSRVVLVTCRVHGDFTIEPVLHLKGLGCPQCGFEGLSIERREALEWFLTQAPKIHGTRYDYSLAWKAIPNVVVLCQRHGEFEINMNKHLLGTGCPQCKRIGVSNIANHWLNKLGVSDDPEHREVRGLIPKHKRVTVDGFDPATNTVYEFYGDAAHGNPEVFNPEHMSARLITYGELNRRRLERESWIREAGFNLVTVWEREFKLQNQGWYGRAD